MQQSNPEVDRILAQNGHHSLMGVRWQSWGGFTGALFREKGPRGEFDVLDAFFSLPPGEPARVEWSEDDRSLTSVYFGRPLKVATLHLHRVPDDRECNYGCELQDLLDELNPLLPRVYEEHGEAALHCDPILVIQSITLDENMHHYLAAYFVWQYKKKQEEEE